MSYQQFNDACFEEQLGSRGVSRKRFGELLSQLAEGFSALKTRQDKSAAPVLDVPGHAEDIGVVEALSAQIRHACDTVVVAGTGGSGLSGRTLIDFNMHSSPKFHFLENIDPDVMDSVLAHIDCSKTCFLVISKSGTTAETLAQFFTMFDYVAGKIGKMSAVERFFVITMPGDSTLRRFAERHGITVIDHAPVGGRFSILTNVGLLPAAIAGIDIRALRRGAQMALGQLDGAVEASSAASGAALNYAFIEKNIPISVLFPYSDRLLTFSAWWRQGWAESLGKQGKGSTAVRAVGITDQHSQLQLYLDGPKDKFFTMIMLNRVGQGIRIEDKDAPDYLRGRTVGDLMAAEQKATFETLVRHHCPVRFFMLESLKEEQLGALLMHFMLEIILTGRLLQVNPFDQPAVEEGKHLAREYLLAGKV